jgi:hypothetical protein
MFDKWPQRKRRRTVEEGLSLVELALLELAGEVRKLTARDIHMERYMKQSTTDVVNAVTDLGTTINSIIPLIDAAVAAQASGDDAALEAAVGQLGTFKQTLVTHSTAVATAAAAVVAAPAETDPAAAAAVVAAATPTPPVAPVAPAGS